MTDAADMLAKGYRPYKEMPPEYKDGRLVLLADPEVGENFLMRWNPDGYNILFSKEKVGIWILVDGTMTWSDEDPDAAPGWWKLPDFVREMWPS